jgi:hypothetical protein
MLRKSIMAAALLAVLLLLAPGVASAQVRFGVTIGDPYYSPGYYSGYYRYRYPVYSGPMYSYPQYVPQYVYRYPVFSNYYYAVPQYVEPRYRYKDRRYYRRDNWDRRWRR